MAKFVEFILDTIDAHWDTNNYSPKPIPFNQIDSQRRDTGERVKDVDVTENNVITVGSQPTTNRTPIGFGHTEDKVNAGTNVRLEGVHTHQRGHITDDDDFQALINEAQRCILLHRRYPAVGTELVGATTVSSDTTASDPGDYHSLKIIEGNDRSVDHGDAYRYDFTVEFDGYEELP